MRASDLTANGPWKVRLIQPTPDTGRIVIYNAEEEIAEITTPRELSDDHELATAIAAVVNNFVLIRDALRDLLDSSIRSTGMNHSVCNAVAVLADAEKELC